MLFALAAEANVFKFVEYGDGDQVTWPGEGSLWVTVRYPVFKDCVSSYKPK